MKEYRYRAVNTAGEIVRGKQAAESPRDLEDRLARQQLELLEASVPRQGWSLRPRSLPVRDLINVLIHLQTLSAAGVPLLDALIDLRDSSDAATIRGFVADLVDRIEGGAPLSRAMAESPWPIDEVVINLVMTGETTGKLPEVLTEIIHSLKWSDEVAQQTKKVLRTPAITGVVVFAAVVFLMVYLVPQLLVFIQSLDGVIPPQTVALMWFSDFLVNQWYVLVCIPPLLWLLIHSAQKMSPPFRLWLDRIKLEWPPLGPILKKIVLSRFANAFALMYRSGVPIIDALSYCERLSPNIAYQKALENALREITEGQKISDAFSRQSLFPPLVIRMIRVGESTGALDKALDNVSYFYRREVNDAVEKLQSAIQPALTFFLGGMIAWIVSAVLLPIYDLIANIKL